MPLSKLIAEWIEKYWQMYHPNDCQISYEYAWEATKDSKSSAPIS